MTKYTYPRMSGREAFFSRSKVKVSEKHGPRKPQRLKPCALSETSGKHQTCVPSPRTMPRGALAVLAVAALLGETTAPGPPLCQHGASSLSVDATSLSTGRDVSAVVEFYYTHRRCIRWDDHDHDVALIAIACVRAGRCGDRFAERATRPRLSPARGCSRREPSRAGRAIGRRLRVAGSMERAQGAGGPAFASKC